MSAHTWSVIEANAIFCIPVLIIGFLWLRALWRFVKGDGAL